MPVGMTTQGGDLELLRWGMVLLIWVEVIVMSVVGRTLGVVVVVVLFDDKETVLVWLVGVMVKKTGVEEAAWEAAAVLVEHAVRLMVLPLSTDPVV